MAGMATDRKWHPALESGNALREEIDKGELVSPEQVEPAMLGRQPVEEVPPAKEPPAKEPPAKAASAEDDDLPVPTYVEADIDEAPVPAAASSDYSRAAAELAELQRQLQEERQAREQLLAQMAELEESRQREALAQDVVFEDDELTITDPTEAQLIARKAAEAADKRNRLAMLEMEKRIKADLEKQYAAQKAASAKQVEDEKWAITNSRILTAVPDAQDIMKTPTYKAYANQRLEDGSTRLSRLQSAYVDGNTDYIIKVLNKVKAALPDFAGVTRVMPNASGSKLPVQSGGAGEDVSETNLSGMLNSVITGGREDREKFRAVWAAKANKAAEASPQS